MEPITLAKAREIEDELVRLRRTVHQNPELGFHEFKTAQLVVDVLSGLGIEVRTGVGKTGVVGRLGRKDGGPTIALRADMDALPLQEENDVPYKSQVPGVMHACGHDTHVAMLLGVAMLLSKYDLPGEVRFLFQPAEEIADSEDKSGAVRMVEEGAMEGVDAVLAVHVDSMVEAGTITYGKGYTSAAVDTFHAKIIGVGGHGAAPHQTVDPVWMLGPVLMALHGIVSRRVDPTLRAVVSVGAVHGGKADNVIPHEVLLEGTLRSYEDEVREQLIEEVERALSVTRALGGDYELKIIRGYPPVYEDPTVASWMQKVGTDLLGEGKVIEQRPMMGSEDYGYMTEVSPGSMSMIGGRIDDGKKRPHHSAEFDIDESVLPIGTALLAETARRFIYGEFEEKL